MIITFIRLLKGAVESLKIKINLHRTGSVVALMLMAFFAQNVSAMQELGDDALSENVGYGLLLSDKIDGAAGTNMTFYRMALNGELGLNLNIDKLQLGCGGFNNTVPGAGNACDIDIDYLQMMGRRSGTMNTTETGAGGENGGLIGGQTITTAATRSCGFLCTELNPAFTNNIVNEGAAATSQFKMIRPYLDLAIKNDSGNGREIVGFKIGAERVDGFIAMGHKMTTNTNGGGTAGCNTTAANGAGAYFCHDGLNRFSGYAQVQVNGAADNGLLGANIKLHGTPTMWGTRLNRMLGQVEVTDSTIIGGIGNGTTDLTAALTMLHGMVISQEDARTRGVYDRDDFFISFQREAVAYPTYGKADRYSHMANPGWWMNIPYAVAGGVRINLDGAAAPAPDGEMGVIAPDNCLGGLKFC